MLASRRLTGHALHAGIAVAATLVRRPGPLSFRQLGVEVALDRLAVARADQGVTLAAGGLRFDLAEHLLAAFVGLGVRSGVCVEVEGPELPLLDGGAARWCDALLAIDAPRSHDASVVVARSATLRVGASSYAFAPSASTRVVVRVSFPAPVGDEDAHWDGDAADFASRIAPARTFGWLRDHAALLAAGRARGADRSAVVVYDEAGVVPGGARPVPGEAARHKLLDLLGDLAPYGGALAGSLVAERPGHAATHRALEQALRQGIVVRRAPMEQEARR